jgi:hypothetical protein
MTPYACTICGKVPTTVAEGIVGIHEVGTPQSQDGYSISCSLECALKLKDTWDKKSHTSGIKTVEQMKDIYNQAFNPIDEKTKDFSEYACKGCGKIPIHSISETVFHKDKHVYMVCKDNEDCYNKLMNKIKPAQEVNEKRRK